MLAEKACKIAKQKKAETKIGILYAICIPKSIIQNDKTNFAYQCHPYGKQCKCFSGSDRIKLLEKMQSNESVVCKSGLKAQYRLLTSRLEEEKNVRAIAVDALPKGKRKIYRDQVKELAQEARQYSDLYYFLLDTQEKDPTALSHQIRQLLANPTTMNDQIKSLLNIKDLKMDSNHIISLLNKFKI